MLEWLQKLFKKKKKYPLLNEINLLRNKINNLYEYKYRSTKLNFIEKDIITYIEVLKDINNFDLNHSRYNIKNIHDNLYIELPINIWYTNNGYVLSTINEFNIWLDMVYKFIIWYNDNILNPDIIPNYNARKLQPYYHNIKMIIEELVRL